MVSKAIVVEGYSPFPHETYYIEPYITIQEPLQTFCCNFPGGPEAKGYSLALSLSFDHF